MKEGEKVRSDQLYRQSWRSVKSRAIRFGGETLRRCDEKPFSEAFRFRAATRNDPAEILLYDEVGFWGVTAKDFVLALAQAPADQPVRVRINSPGGDVFDGLAIFNALSARAGVTCVVDGVAASIASVIACAGATVEMAEQSMLMIHNAWAGIVGDKRDMVSMAGVMDKIDGRLAAMYAGKSGKSTNQFAAMMDAETWLTSTEAKAVGLCDTISAASVAEARSPAAISAGHGQRLRRLRLAEAHEI